MAWDELDRQLDALQDAVALFDPATPGQPFFDQCAAEASSILEHAHDAAQASHAIERISAIFDEIGVDAQRLLSKGQRRALGAA